MNPSHLDNSVPSAGRSRRIMLIAGETSGDLLASELVRELRKNSRDRLTFFGAGGPALAREGVELAIDLTQHSVIGFAEALAKYFEFKKIFRLLLALARREKPDVIICVDFFGFNGRFGAALRSAHKDWKFKLVQFVSPQVWASRPKRAERLARYFDLLISVLPFEKQWYREKSPGLRVEFVGHPILERHPHSSSRKMDPPLILLLPGSRAGEIRRHLAPMLEAADLIQKASPARFRIVLPAESPVTQAHHGLHAGDCPIQMGNLSEALQEATLAVASTGTVTLECALFSVPTIAIYKTSWSTYRLGKALITVDYLAMPNLLAGEEIFPELIQGAATGERIAQEAITLLNDPSRQSRIQNKLQSVINSLGQTGASTRAAQLILKLLDEP